MKIIIWTKAIPKVEAIKNWIKELPYIDIKDTEIITIKVESLVSDMPISIKECMDWAKNRALNCKKEISKWDFFIWMEWWTTMIWEKAYLFWVVYVLNQEWEWHFWFSAFLEVPEVFRDWIYNQKKTLEEVHLEKFWNQDVWQKNGSFWQWSDNLIQRKDMFQIAFICAISPFFNKYYKL